MKPYLLRILVSCALIAALAGLAPRSSNAQESGEAQKPTRHFRVDKPAGLTPADALIIYSRILKDMVDGYALSLIPAAKSYSTWRRYNKTPYRSAQHGERYVNNYANGIAKNYGRFEEAGTMPVGAVLAKDSFAVTARGDVFSGPLFVMEKMPVGFNEESRDWRYSMIMPDGSLFGATNGVGSDRVQFCIACHKVVAEEFDQMFFIPKELRVRFLNQ